MVVCVTRGQLITKDGVNCSSPYFFLKATRMPIPFLVPCLPFANHLESHEECDVFVYMALDSARLNINSGLYSKENQGLLNCFLIVPSPDADTQVSP